MDSVRFLNLLNPNKQRSSAWCIIDKLVRGKT